MEDKLGHGLNTNETRIQFSVHSVFHPRLPALFVSFVYFVVPSLRAKSFHRNMRKANLNQFIAECAIDNRISPVRQAGPTAVVQTPPASMCSCSRPTPVLLPFYPNPTSILLRSYHGPARVLLSRTGRKYAKTPGETSRPPDIQSAKKKNLGQKPRYAPESRSRRSEVRCRKKTGTFDKKMERKDDGRRRDLRVESRLVPEAQVTILRVKTDSQQKEKGMIKLIAGDANHTT